MGQEFFVKSDTLEDKVRKILPSQGGLGQGFDLSASTQIIPIVDLTESAEGSTLRADLQTALSFDNANTFAVSNTTTTIITNTGYYRILSALTMNGVSNTAIILTDGATNKTVAEYFSVAGSTINKMLDLTVFVDAGDSVQLYSSSTSGSWNGSFRQIATIDGELVNP